MNLIVICSVCRRSVLVVFLGVALLLRRSAALLMSHYYVVFLLFCQYLVVCSASVSSSVVPRSGVSGFTAFLKTRLRCKWITIMDERDGNDALNMSTLKELRFRQKSIFAKTSLFGGVPRNLFPAKTDHKDLNYCGHK